MNSLTQFPPLVLRGLASHVRLYADGLDHAAWLGDGEINEALANRKYARRVENAAKHFFKMIDGGANADQATNATASRFNLESKAIRVLAPGWSMKMRRTQDIALDRRIMKLHRSGLSDPEIAAKVGKHRNTVATRRRKIMED